MNKPRPIARAEWDFDGIRPEAIAMVTLWEYLRECPRWVRFCASVQSAKVGGQTIQKHLDKHKVLACVPDPLQQEIWNVIQPMRLPVSLWELLANTSFFRDFPKTWWTLESATDEPRPPVEFRDTAQFIKTCETQKDPWEFAKRLLTFNKVIRIEWGRHSQRELARCFEHQLSAESKMHPQPKRGWGTHVDSFDKLRSLSAMRLQRAGYSFDAAILMIEKTIPQADKKTISGPGSQIYPVYYSTSKWYAACSRAKKEIAELNLQAPEFPT
jgi:hypothetical protein